MSITDFAETADALNALKKSGKVLHIGVSNFTREQMEEIGRYCTLEAYQPQYSMVVRTNEEQMKWAAEQGMGVDDIRFFGRRDLNRSIPEADNL